jgi:hypothetical protein
MTTAYVTWSTVKRLVLEEGSQVEPQCAEAGRAVFPDGSTQEAEVGFPLAANLLDIYRYRYQSIEEFRGSRHGWPGFSQPWRLLPDESGFWRSAARAGGSSAYSPHLAGWGIRRELWHRNDWCEQLERQERLAGRREGIAAVGYQSLCRESHVLQGGMKRHATPAPVFDP